MATVAKLSGTRSAALASEFGRNMTEKWFPGVNIEHFPKFTKGPRKGQPNGTVYWVKCESGGWHREFGVIRPGIFCKALVDDKNKVIIAISGITWGANDWFREILRGVDTGTLAITGLTTGTLEEHLQERQSFKDEHAKYFHDGVILYPSEAEWIERIARKTATQSKTDVTATK